MENVITDAPTAKAAKAKAPKAKRSPEQQAATNAKRAATRAANQAKKELKTSTTGPVSRAEYAKGRPPRVPTHGAGKLRVPPAILEDIRQRGCTPHLAVDNGQGSLNKYIAAWWEIYTDANGQSFKMPAGNGDMHVLMIIPTELIEEDRRLRKEKRNARMEITTNLDTSGDAPDYLPEGRENVLERETLG